MDVFTAQSKFLAGKRFSNPLTRGQAHLTLRWTVLANFGDSAPEQGLDNNRVAFVFDMRFAGQR